ncbi:globin domain-containing protein, partial [Staphylococcus epidermidis]|uniref:globin domain-containing protein n=1 Tax=Staphylococcus epidermidis TaxID=1282 RepID=UPI0011A1C03D
ADFNQTSPNHKQFFTHFLPPPHLYTQQHPHPILKPRHIQFTITHYQPHPSLHNIHTPIQHPQLPPPLAHYFFHPLTLTPNHILNS